MLLPARSNRCMRIAQSESYMEIGALLAIRFKRFPFVLSSIRKPPAGNTGSARARASVFVTESIGVHEVIGILQLFLKLKIHWTFSYSAKRSNTTFPHLCQSDVFSLFLKHILLK